jgi:hypothetical protein
MRLSTAFALLLSLATLWGCSSQPAAVPLLPRVDVQGYGKLGLVHFASNSDAAINALVTSEFESHLQAAQPGARIVELGSRESLLAAVGSRELDARALRKIGRKYAVDAIIVGNVNYSEPKTEMQVADVAQPEGALRGDIAYTLIETRSGDSVWRSSARAGRPFVRAKVSAEQGGPTRGASNPREALVSSLVYDLTEDFRPTSVNPPSR